MLGTFQKGFAFLSRDRSLKLLLPPFLLLGFGCGVWHSRNHFAFIR